MWMLDTGTLDRLARLVKEQDSAWECPPTLLNTCEHIIAVETKDNDRIQHLLAQRSKDGSPWIVEHKIELPSPTADVLAHLRPSSTLADKNYGEDCCIALCLTVCSEMTLVSNDKHASWRALFELGRGRVACELDLWAWLRDAGHIENSDFERLYQATLKALQFRPPPWRFHHDRGSPPADRLIPEPHMKMIHVPARVPNDPVPAILPAWVLKQLIELILRHALGLGVLVQQLLDRVIHEDVLDLVGVEE